MTKRLGNIASIILSLCMAALFAVIILKPAATPRKIVSSVQSVSLPEPSVNMQDQIHLAEITLPPPPQVEEASVPTPEPTSAPNSVKKIHNLVATLSKSQEQPQKITPVKASIQTELPAVKITTLKAEEQPVPAITTHEPKPVKTAPTKPASLTKEILPIQMSLEETKDYAPPPQEEAPTVTPEAAQEIVVTKKGEESKTGRALLQLLEHGNGPAIEIAWPDDSHQQTKLNDIFSQCFGMITAVMNPQGMLYRAEDTRGQIWDINTDRYSGFVRQLSGRTSSDEQQSANMIRKHHGINQPTQIVRIFPREVDALLLGGLHRLVGPEYNKNHNIKARYKIDNGLAKIDDLIIDDTPLEGSIVFHVNETCQGRYGL